MLEVVCAVMDQKTKNKIGASGSYKRLRIAPSDWLTGYLPLHRFHGLPRLWHRLRSMYKTRTLPSCWVSHLPPQLVGGQRQMDCLWVQSQSSSHSKLQVSQGYLVRLSQNQQKQRNRPIRILGEIFKFMSYVPFLAPKPHDYLIKKNILSLTSEFL